MIKIFIQRKGGADRAWIDSFLSGAAGADCCSQLHPLAPSRAVRVVERLKLAAAAARPLFEGPTEAAERPISLVTQRGRTRSRAGDLDVGMA